MQIWLQLLAVMFGVSILKSIFYNVMLRVILDLAAFGACYFLLRRYPFIDLRKSLIFIGILTVTDILVDLNIIGGWLINIVFFGVIIWFLYKRNGGGGSGRPKLRHKWHK